LWIWHVPDREIVTWNYANSPFIVPLMFYILRGEEGKYMLHVDGEYPHAIGEDGGVC